MIATRCRGRARARARSGSVALQRQRRVSPGERIFEEGLDGTGTALDRGRGMFCARRERRELGMRSSRVIDGAAARLAALVGPVALWR